MWQGMDQRRFPRVRHTCVVSLRQATSRPAISATTENIGIGGVCVLLDRGLDIFAPVDVELMLEEGAAPLTCRGMIAWVVRRREMNQAPLFDTGIEFVGLTPEDEVRLQRAVAVADRSAPA